MVAAGKMRGEYSISCFSSNVGLKRTGVKVPNPECEVLEVNMTKLMHGWLILSSSGKFTIVKKETFLRW